jgi:hypothetical protein
MKKYIWAFILLNVAIIVIYTIPKSINREYEGFIYGYEDVKIDGHVKVKLDGKLYPKIFGDNIFKGKINMNNHEINISSPLPGNYKMVIQGMKDKVNRHTFYTISSMMENGLVKTEGTFIITRDFDFIMGYTNNLREEYSSNNVLMVCPARNRDEAKKIMSSRDIFGN